jgi:hypothetical protein
LTKVNGGYESIMHCCGVPALHRRIRDVGLQKRALPGSCGAKRHRGSLRIV